MLLYIMLQMGLFFSLLQASAPLRLPTVRLFCRLCYYIGSKNRPV